LPVAREQLAAGLDFGGGELDFARLMRCHASP
jgi:hypothetical protein